MESSLINRILLKKHMGRELRERGEQMESLLRAE
jgi:hypothetical protein